MYTDPTDIINAVVAIYDSTDESAVQNDTTRRERILHYLQRAAEELWYYRSWPFTMGADTLSMTAGAADYPDDFARISYEGMLLGADGRAWTEVSYQEVAYLRNRGLQQQRRIYAVGVDVRIPDTSNADDFTLIYQTVAPTQTEGSGTGFPAPFGEVLLLGTVVKLKEEEGDERQIWRVDYQRALGRATALWVRSTRTQRMPVTVGGMW